MSILATQFSEGMATAARLDGAFIGDSRITAGTAGSLDVLDPATGAPIGSVPNCGPSEVDQAVRAANEAFHTGWRDLDPSRRASILWRLGDLIDLHGEELAMLETLDMGKPVGVAQLIDVPFAANCFRYMAGATTKLEGATIPVSLPGSWHVYTRRQPLGVVAAITPWNFPLLLVAMKVAPALAAGNTVVLKPSELTPLSALRLAELAKDAGLPPGVLNVVTGEGHTAGASLVSHPDVSKVSFTGSTTVGRSIASAGIDTFKRVSLELGGKSANIILPDADLAKAVAGSAAAIFYNAGQNCMAGSRLFVHRSVFDQVLEGLTQVAESMMLAPGYEATSDMGPLVSAQQRDRVAGFVGRALADGGVMRSGGVAKTGDGFFFEPTVVTDVARDAEIVREEVFGPVLVALPFDTLEDAIAQANDSKYGLAAAVWTGNPSAAHRVTAQLDGGSVFVNCYGVADPGVPFGGFKHSGWGRENGMEVFDNFLETKSVYVSLD